MSLLTYMDLRSAWPCGLHRFRDIGLSHFVSLNRIVNDPAGGIGSYLVDALRAKSLEDNRNYTPEQSYCLIGSVGLLICVPLRKGGRR